MYASLLGPDLREILDAPNVEENSPALREFCDALHPGVVAEILSDLDPQLAWRALAACDSETRATIFEYLSLPQQEDIAESLDRERLSKLIAEMAPDDRADLLSRMPEERVEELLPLLAQAERSDIRRLLSFPEDSVGSIMTTEYATLPETVTTAEAINLLRSQAPDSETIYYVFVVDEDRRLDGVISLRELILARAGTIVRDVMNRDVISARVDDDQEEAAQTLARFDLIALPVVDSQNRIVGIVTHDDVLDVLQEEASEDAYRQAAVGPLEDGYLETPIITLAWKRGVWLMFLAVVALITAGVLRQYEDMNSSESFVWMVLFLPLVLASGGNAGSQSATLVIRTIAVGELDRSEHLALARRELIVGLALGGALAAVGFAAAILWFGLSFSGGLVVALTVILVVLMGTLAGAALPLLFQKIGMDPALMSNPLIAALVDVVGVIIYYNVAMAIIG